MMQPPADDANREDSWSDDPLTWAEAFVVPDDISSLEPDIEQWRREQALARRRGQLDRARRVVPMRWRRYGVTAPMLIATLLLLGSLGGLMMLIGPHASAPRAPGAQPLASPTTLPGRVGGLLPAQHLNTLTGNAVAIRNMRPAIFTLIPAGCDCRAAITHLKAVAAPYGLTQYVVASDAAAARTMSEGQGNRVVGLVDAGASMLALFGATTGQPTLVMVSPNGIVRAIESGTHPGTNLTGDLDVVLAPAIGAPTS